jgi:hypothetical protein
MSKQTCGICGASVGGWSARYKDDITYCTKCFYIQKKLSETDYEENPLPLPKMDNESIGSNLGRLGITLLVVGIIWGVIAMSMETSVTIRSSDLYPNKRVVNFSLMQNQRNHLMLAGLTILVGAIFTGVGYARSTKSDSPVDNDTVDTRQCPFCAEEIKQTAKICKHCQREVS